MAVVNLCVEHDLLHALLTSHGPHAPAPLRVQLDEVLPGAVRLRFNCTEFVIRHKDAAGVW